MPVQSSPDQSTIYRSTEQNAKHRSTEQNTTHNTTHNTKHGLETRNFSVSSSMHPGFIRAKGLHSQAGFGRAPGTFGELLQGALAGDSNNFLVTFPIARQVTTVFESAQSSREIQTVPSGKHKSVRLIRRLLDDQGIEAGGTLTFLEQLPEGKGLASSSADMVASARAVADYYRFEVGEAYLSALLGEIEPTDGVMYDECVSFFHRRCKLIERLGALPPLRVVGVDEGSTVDTVEFNARAKSHSDMEIDEYSRLLRIISVAIHQRDKRAIGKVSTRSAEINQKYNPKRYLKLAIAVSETLDALGVVVAHSGTYVGVLLDPEREDADRQLYQVQIAMSQSSLPVEVFHSF